jgi:O-antigen/teichoic acid export membrane protein
VSSADPPDPSSDRSDGRGSALLSTIVSETALFAALSVVTSILAWAANLLLARLLDKRDFGVFGICTFFVGLGSLLGDGGLAAALLRRKEELTRDALRAAASFALLVGATMAVVLFALAPWLGAKYQLRPDEVVVLRAMAPLYLLGAARMVPYVRLERALRFSVVARVELLASLVRHGLAIAVASAHGGVWALVLSNLASALVQCGLAYRASPGWPGLALRWSVLRPLLGFGAKVQSLGVLAYIKDNVSRAMLGQAMGPAAVGVFDFGLAYIQLPVQAVNSLARVQLPVYARLDAKDPTLFAALRGALRAGAILGVPSLIALALIAPWAIPTFYDPKWAPAYPVIRGLLVNMIAGLAASPLFGLMQGQDRAGLAIGVFAVWTALTWVLSLASVGVFPQDLGAIAWVYSGVTAIVVAGMFVWSARLLGRGLFSAVRAPVLAGAVAVAIACTQDRFGPSWLSHPIACGVGSLLTYTATLLLLEGAKVLEEARSLLRRKPREAPTAQLPPGSDAPPGSAPPRDP